MTTLQPARIASHVKHIPPPKLKPAAYLVSPVMGEPYLSFRKPDDRGVHYTKLYELVKSDDKK